MKEPPAFTRSHAADFADNQPQTFSCSPYYTVYASLSFQQAFSNKSLAWSQSPPSGYCCDYNFVTAIKHVLSLETGTEIAASQWESECSLQDPKACDWKMCTKEACGRSVWGSQSIICLVCLSCAMSGFPLWLQLNFWFLLKSMHIGTYTLHRHTCTFSMV